MEPDFTGVIVAAGRSSRFAGSVTKQFRDLSGRSVLERSVRGITSCPGLRGVIVVLAPEELAGPRAAPIGSWPGVLGLVAGGASRSASVRRGLAAVGEAAYVLIHDAARPMVSPTLVNAVMEATRRHGAAVPGLRVVDTVKQIDQRGRVVQTLERNRLRLAQTPQGFRTDWLRSALEQQGADQAALTDEAIALELAGHRVVVVDGDPDNLKITSVRDLEQARWRLGGAVGEFRVGTGFDIHRRGGDRPLVLGGVTFEGEVGLIGHSDADVILHAAMDALLGAASLGDIGEHFPPDDPRFAGASSSDLASQVAARVRDAGFDLVNLDLTLLAESPRIRDRVEEMRGVIAASLEIPPERVGLKATTLEGLGSVGRGEGIACQAVGLLRSGPEKP